MEGRTFRFRGIVASVVVLSLLIGMAAPSWAAAPIVADDGAGAVVLPEGDLLTEAELSEVEGELGPLGIFAVRIIGGAAVGGVAGGVASYIKDGHVSWRAVAAGAAAGALGGAWGGFLKVRGW